MTKRTQEQNRRIYGLINGLGKLIGKENADLFKTRACIEVSGQEHSSALSALEAEELITRLNAEIKKVDMEEKELQDRSDMLMWINKSFEDLYILQNVAEAAHANYKNNFIKRITGKIEIKSYKDKYSVFEALKDSIARLTNQGKIGAMLQELSNYRVEMNDWEKTAFGDFMRQWFRYKKLDSAAKIKKVLEIYNKYCGQVNLRDVARVKEKEAANSAN